MAQLQIHPPTTAWPMAEGNEYKRSWGEGDSYLNEEHGRIFKETESLPGWQDVRDSEKLYCLGSRRNVDQDSRIVARQLSLPTLTQQTPHRQMN